MIKGVHRNGLIELTTPVDWPVGCPVRVTLYSSSPLGNGEWLDEATWQDTPENREWLIAEWEALEPPTE